MIGTLSELFNHSDGRDLTQRRHERRFSCHVPVLCTHGSRTDSAVIVDFAREGLRLLLPRQAKRGAVLHLHYNSNAETATEPVRARVVWTRRCDDQYEVGVECKEDQMFWIPGLLRSLDVQPDPADVRRTLRFSTVLLATVRAAAESASGQLVDLSLGGAAFCGGLAGPVGETIQLSIAPPRGRGLTVSGRIVHQVRQEDARWRLGIRFEGMTPAITDKLSRLLRNLAKTRKMVKA